MKLQKAPPDKALCYLDGHVFYAVIVQQPPSLREWIAVGPVACAPALFPDEEDAENYADELKAGGVAPVYIAEQDGDGGE